MNSCNDGPEEWQELAYVEDLRCDSLHSVSIYHPIECKPYFDDDTLVVYISNLSWEYVIVKIHDGKFRAELDGVPFGPFELSFKTKSERLQVGKTHYVLNDTLCAAFDFLFQVIDVETNETNDWNFKGFICEVIREKGFDPLEKENFMNFDLPTAIHEIGEPLSLYCFNMDTTYMGEFGIELLNYLPSDRMNIEVRELTWDVSPARDVSDGGRDRLTIWYIRKQDSCYLRNDGHYKLSDIWSSKIKSMSTWIPLHYSAWNEDWQF